MVGTATRRRGRRLGQELTGAEFRNDYLWSWQGAYGRLDRLPAWAG